MTVPDKIPERISNPFAIHSLNTVGYKVSPPIPPRAFRAWSFFYLVSGEVLEESEGEPHLVKGHEFLLLSPGIPFSIKYYRDSIGYMGGFEEGILTGTGYKILQKTGTQHIKIGPEDMVLVDESFSMLLRRASDPVLAGSGLDLLLRLLEREIHTEQQDNSLSGEFLRRVFSLGKPSWNVSEYAEALGVTPDHLTRSVREYTGRPASDWIATARVSKAKDLLRRKEIPIIDIASAVGIPDQSYFSRFFKKITGQTPSDFRKSLG